MRSCRRCSLRPVARAVGKRSPIGQIGGGKNERSGIIDIATFQSLVEKDEEGYPRAKDFVKEYGLVIVDECHHGAAAAA